jgi:hypothetical protein
MKQLRRRCGEARSMASGHWMRTDDSRLDLDHGTERCSALEAARMEDGRGGSSRGDHGAQHILHGVHRHRDEDEADITHRIL